MRDGRIVGGRTKRDYIFRIHCENRVFISFPVKLTKPPPNTAKTQAEVNDILYYQRHILSM